MSDFINIEGDYWLMTRNDNQVISIKCYINPPTKCPIVYLTLTAEPLVAHISASFFDTSFVRAY